MQNLTLLTDLYQLTMLAGYFDHQKLQQKSCFELYFRRLPFQGGFCVAAGLETALDYLENVRFTESELDYLRSLELFCPEFLTWLEDFRFTGTVLAVQEGELVFPNEPILSIRAPLPEAQLVESALLNIINFQTLIATKAARISLASRGGQVLEFGLRRAQGIDGSLAASRAAYLGGCQASSNTLAGQLYGIPVKGTHAHSWIMSFNTELEAFRAYAQTFPESCILLVDTFDTLKSGLPNAIVVARELASTGHRLAGIRLDSGDLAQLSIEARRMLDEAGFEDAVIVASNDLDEHTIHSLLEKGARIDVWGVGTNLVTAKDEPALGGVYKLVASDNGLGDYLPKIKISSNPVKTTTPGLKQVYRVTDQDGQMIGDCQTLEGELVPEEIDSFSVSADGKSRSLAGSFRPLLSEVMTNGKTGPRESSLALAQQRCREELSKLPEAYKRLVNPEKYWVGLSPNLSLQKVTMMKNAELNSSAKSPDRQP